MLTEDWITTSWNADPVETLDCKAIIASTLWMLWKQCNVRVFGGAEMNADMLVRRAVQFGKDYAKQGRPSCTPARPQVARWTHPAEGWIKVNVDGAFSMVDRLGGAGAVIRAADDTLVAAAWEPSAGESSLRTEGHTLRLGLRLAAGYAKVEVESDSLELVRIMQN
ncbi:uncharacterized protein [Typha latifolia]|uniref:uncharacterized protein n=1 Tax=Typha latifolia TaxID=4733 RepID=UPI003C2ECD1B